MAEEKKKNSKAKIIGKRLFLGLGILFLAIQLYQPERVTKKPEVGKDFLLTQKPPAEVEKIFRTSCYDCHSHETIYPWYSSVAPVSWFVNRHIEEGREEMNLSDWGSYSREKQSEYLEEMAEEVEESEMPLPSYTWLHWEARLSPQQIKVFIRWLAKKRKTLGEKESYSHEED